MSRLRVGLLTSVGRTLDAFFVDMVRHWNANGAQIFAAAGTPAKHIECEVIAHLSQSPKIENVLSLLHLRQWVRDGHLDVVLTNTATASALARLAPLGVPVVYFCHGLHWDAPELRTLPWRAIERLLRRRTSGVITINSDDEAWFRRQYRATPLLRLLHGVGLDTLAFPRVSAPRDQSLRLTWIGDFTPRKDPFLALEAFRILHESRPDAQLTMGGEGPLRLSVARKVRDYHLERAVLLPGRVDPALTLANSHAILHTAHWEGYPRVLVEALAVGRQIFACDAKGTRDIPGAHLARSRAPEELADLVVQHDPVRTGPRTSVSHADLDYRRAADSILDFLRVIT